MLEAVAALVTAERPEWRGTATELVAALGLDMKPNALAMRLNVRAWRLSYEYHIHYEKRPNPCRAEYQAHVGGTPGVTTVTAVTAFGVRRRCVKHRHGRHGCHGERGRKSRGAYLRVEIAASQYNPYPLTFGPRKILAGRWKGPGLSTLPNGE